MQYVLVCREPAQRSTETSTWQAAYANQRGNSLVLSIVVLTAISTLGAYTFSSARTGMNITAINRSQAVAAFAAESGAAVTMQYLRTRKGESDNWTAMVAPAGHASMMLSIPGNHQKPATGGTNSGNLFDPQMGAWYAVDIINNPTDPTFGQGRDDDARVIIRSTGYGPDGSMVQLEYDVSGTAMTGGAGRPCPNYGQRGIAEDGSGRNDCLGDIDAGSTATFRPGD